MKNNLPTERSSTDGLHQLQIRNALRGLLFIACIAAMYFARDFMLPVVLAIFVALTLRPAIRYLSRHGLPAPFTAFVFVIVILMSGFAVTTLPMLTGVDTIAGLSNVQRYAQQITQRPAWQRAMDIAGPQAKRPG